MTETKTEHTPEQTLAEKLDRITALKLEHAEKREENWFNEPNLVDRILNSIEKIKKLATKRKKTKLSTNKIIQDTKHKSH